MYNPRADSADDKLMIFFLFFPENRIKHFMQMSPNLHEMSKSGKNKQNTSNCHLLKLLPGILSNKMAMLSDKMAWYNVYGLTFCLSGNHLSSNHLLHVSNRPTTCII